jgi:hypothetical protein
MMISMKNNDGRLPIPERRHQEPVTNPLAGVVGDLAIPAFLDAKKTESAKASAAAIKGRLSQLAQTINGGGSPTNQPTMETDVNTQTQTATKTTSKIDASGGKAALRAAARRAVADTKVPVKKIAAGMTAAKKADEKAGKTKKVALADAITSDVSGSKPTTRKASARKVEARTSLYDWSAAEAKAKAGTVPPTPPFASYGPHMKKAHDMAKAGQAKELREYLADFNHEEPIPPSRRNLFRYGDLCLQAVKKGA